MIGIFYVIRNKETKQCVKPHTVSSTTPHLYHSEKKALAVLRRFSQHYQDKHEVITVQLTEMKGA